MKEQEIREAYEQITAITDNKGRVNFTCHYSFTVQLSPSSIDKLRNIFSNFNFTHLYLNWYIVGFNKPLDWAIKNA